MVGVTTTCITALGRLRTTGLEANTFTYRPHFKYGETESQKELVMAWNLISSNQSFSRELSL